MRFVKLISFFCLLLVFTACEDEEVVHADKKRGFNQEQLDKAKEQKEYQYKPVERPKQNPFAELLYNILSFLGQFFGSAGVYVVLIIVAILIVFFLLQGSTAARDNGDPLIKDILEASESTEEEKEEITSLKALQKRIRKSVDEEDYQSAIRFSFLLLLYRLNEKERIRFHKQKTNSQYYYEVPDGMKSPYMNLSQVYDLVLFGQRTTSLAVWKYYQVELKTLEDHERLAP